MSEFYVIGGTVIYTLIGVRAFATTRRAEAIKDAPTVLCPLFIAVMWPMCAVILGFGTLMMGNAGLFDGIPHKEAA